MTLADDHPALLDRAPLTTSWRVRRQTLFLYEVDSDALADQVPAALPVSEVRPGIGLFTVECLHYVAGHFGDADESFELVLSVVVAPDLAIRMPMPKFSLYVTSVISSSATFVERERVLLRTPMEHAPELAMAFSADGTSVEVRDRGRPLLACRNTSSAAPVFEPQVAWGLIYTNLDDELHQGAFRWEGHVAEHQKRGDHGAFTTTLRFADSTSDASAGAIARWRHGRSCRRRSATTTSGRAPGVRADPRARYPVGSGRR